MANKSMKNESYYVITDSAARDFEVLHFSGPILKNYKYYKMCIFMKSK